MLRLCRWIVSRDAGYFCNVWHGMNSFGMITFADFSGRWLPRRRHRPGPSSMQPTSTFQHRDPRRPRGARNTQQNFEETPNHTLHTSNVSNTAIMPDIIDPRMMSVQPRLRYNTIGGVNGPLVILESVRSFRTLVKL